MATRKPPKPLDPLDALAAADPREVIALMLWRDRMRNPELALQIGEEELEQYTACIRYLKVAPQVRIFRPQGVPAQDAIPATGNRRAVPARAAIPPRPYVIVSLVDKDGNAIKPIESTQENYDASLERERVRRFRDNAPQLAQQLLNMAKSGEYSLAVMQECADALIALARPT